MDDRHADGLSSLLPAVVRCYILRSDLGKKILQPKCLTLGLFIRQVPIYLCISDNMKIL